MKKEEARVPESFRLGDFRVFLYEQEKSAATIDKYMRDAEMFAVFCHERMEEKRAYTPAELRRVVRMRGQSEKTIVLRYKELLSQRYAPASVNSMLASVNAYLRFLGREDLCVRHLREQHAHVRMDRRELEPEEVERMIRYAKEKKNPAGLCLLALAFTGARVGEMRFFTVEGVRSGVIEIRNKGKVRRVLLPEQLRTVLLEYCSLRGLRSGQIFLTKKGRPIDRSNFYRAFRTLARRTGVPEEKAYPHNLRHFFARMYYNKTRDLTGLADLLGHSSINVTRIYTADPQQKYLDTLRDIYRDTLPEKK